EVFAEQLPLIALADGADEEPALGVDVDRLFGNAFFFGLLVAGTLQDEALAVPGLLDLLPAEILHVQGIVLPGCAVRVEGTLQAEAQPELLDGVATGAASVEAIRVARDSQETTDARWLDHHLVVVLAIDIQHARSQAGPLDPAHEDAMPVGRRAVLE